MSHDGPPRHDFLDHTAELALRVEAATWEGLLAEAVRAVGAELIREAGRQAGGPGRSVEVASADREALLVDLINELLFLAETERWAPATVEHVEASDREARVQCAGVVLAGPPSRIKAATLHGLAIRPHAGGLAAEVILDV